MPLISCLLLIKNACRWCKIFHFSTNLRKIGARENENLSHRSLYLYEMDCDVGSMSNATDVKFVIGGHEFVLNPEEYVEETALDIPNFHSY